MKTFVEVNAALSKLYAYSSSGPYDLVTMRYLMDYLGNPQNNIKVVHVAGTSGKTSTSYFIAALLTAAGYKVGLTVSPHVDQVNERVQINMQPLPEAEFASQLGEFLQLVAASGTSPSYFECGMAFAYWYFERVGVDYAVVEVGLGGLLCASNVATRADKVCVITDIGFDHMAILGNTLGAIASQKAGIMHAGNTVLMYGQSAEVNQAVEAQATKVQGTIERLDAAAEQAEYGRDWQAGLPAYQQRNWLLAYAVFRYVRDRDGLTDLTAEQLRPTQAVQVPGRMDVRQVADKTIVMDAAHNAQKFGAFLSSFRQLYPDVKPAVLLSLKQDKEPIDIIPGVVELASRIIITTFDHALDLPAKSRDPQELADQFVEAGATAVSVIADQHAAYQALLDGPEPVCIVTGSIYLLSQFRAAEHLA